MLISRFKVSGHSMEPYLKPGDQVLAVSFLGIKPGDVVVFKYKSKYLIKRVTIISNNNFFVEGDNKEDSLGVRKISKNDIIGKVVLKLP